MRKHRVRCAKVGLLWFLGLVAVDGLIEIVEEQRCHDTELRLTCRDLDSHIAVLEAWYTPLNEYHPPTATPLELKTENDPELNRVYVYSSPNHNGVYEEKLSNHSFFENLTLANNDSFVNDSLWLVNETALSESVSVSGQCGGEEFSRSYASWREGDRRRPEMSWNSSVNLRAPLNYRCTGVNHCNFVVTEDYPPSVRWSPGVVFIKYACFDDTLSVHYCNREVRIAEWGSDSEGYIRTPGYPHFYVGDECRWRLRTHREQRVRITLLDVSLRGLGPFDRDCTDQVSVRESNGDHLFSSCDQVDLPLRLTSGTNVLDVTVEARSEGAYPKRGVLLHYKSIGCITLATPSSGYLVYRNADVAHYMCDVNFVFEDTGERARMLWCYNDNRWNDTVPLCVEEAARKAAGNGTADPGTDVTMTQDKPNMIVDIVIPSLLIAALFIGNALIVLIIYKYRKRKPEDIDDEFNTIPLSVNGVHAGNAV